MATSLKRLAGVLALTFAALLAPIAPASAAPAPDPAPHPLFGKITIRLPDVDASPQSVLNLGPNGTLQTMLLTFKIDFERCGDCPSSPAPEAGAPSPTCGTCPLGTPLV
jgi:hypothetical protein